MNTRNAELVSRLAAAAPALQAIADEGSLTAAARQLGMHQSALSHRLKMLENVLGHPVFLRTTRSITPTDVGKIVLDAAAATLAGWNEALDRIERLATAPQISLTLSSSLALKWLVPALASARDHDLDLSFDVEEEIAPPQRSRSDAAIRFGPGPYPGEFVQHLCDCVIVPVARPGLVSAGDALERLRDGTCPLLFDRRGEVDGTDFSWDRYWSGSGIGQVSQAPRTGFDRADLMIQAAIGGLGIALGRRLLVEGDIAAGLLAVVGPPVEMRSRYWLVTTSEFAERPGYERLLSWLRSEIARTGQAVSLV